MPLNDTAAHLFSNTKGCKGIQGAELKHNQTGGGLGSVSHADTRFNHSSSASYGFDEKGAAIAHEMRGSYPAMTQNNDRQQCGGRKKIPRQNKKKEKKKNKRKKTKKKKTYVVKKDIQKKSEENLKK